MSHLIITKKNEVFLQVKAEPHVYYELADQFTFEVPGAKFMPQYRNKYWDGKIRLFNTQTGEIYVGLLDKLTKFCDDHEYTYEFVNNKFYGLPFETNDFISKEGVKDYMNAICKYSPRDYQVEGVYDALKHNRKLLISPTASGKSLMIYSLVRYYVEKQQNILIVVPTTSLVEQMYKDFADYGWDVGSYCHKIYAGRERETDSQVIITTWQSIYKLPRKYFSRINVVLLKHPAHKFETFEDEVQYIINHERRNKFIRNLALDLKGNTLIIFARVEGHGQPLYDLINNSTIDERQVFFVHGGVDTKDRELVREITEKEDNAIIIASYGTFSTGINIKNLHNVIFASPSKSRIRNLQSIGRVLRKGNNKTKATLYDIADDISYKSRRNYTLNHLIERIKVYNEENFNYDIVNIPLKN